MGRVSYSFFARISRDGSYVRCTLCLHISGKETAMKHDDVKILQEVQRNTALGMTAIDTILDKIGNDEFSLQLSKQSLQYS